MSNERKRAARKAGKSVCYPVGDKFIKGAHPVVRHHVLLTIEKNKWNNYSRVNARIMTPTTASARSSDGGCMSSSIKKQNYAGCQYANYFPIPIEGTI